MKKLSFDELKWLESQLGETKTHSLKLLGEVRSTLRGLLKKNYYVDEFPDFSAAVAVFPKDSSSEVQQTGQAFIQYRVTCFGRSVRKLRSLILEVEDIDWDGPVHFNGSMECQSMFEEVALEKGGTFEVEINPVLKVNPCDLLKGELPKGYVFSALPEDAIPLINENWHMANQTSQDFIHWLTKNFRYVAVCEFNSGKLAAHMIEYYDGSIGILGVLPGHRRKGIARAVIGKLAGLVMEIRGCPVTVRVDSKISGELHRKCGFRNIDALAWVYYAPPSLMEGD